MCRDNLRIEAWDAIFDPERMLMTIETKDHLLLARELACQMKLSHGKKLAFILGNLMPDFNPFSYITFWEHNRFGGHSYRFRKNMIQNYCTGKFRKTILGWYRAGEMMHFLTDSFTRPHNEEFNYPVKDHVRYEHILHGYFKNDLQQGELEEAFLRARLKGTSGRQIQAVHEKYLKESGGVPEDTRYILETTAAVCVYLKEINRKEAYLDLELLASGDKI